MPAIERLLEIAAVVTEVTKPLAFTVTTGIAVVEPKVPTLEFTVAKVSARADPLLVPVASPLAVILVR
ncbi:MAG: hypothetical protein EBY82_04265 [Actinobacteria bacterium]|nr:hypothetical protein [Actinomycetota bacterium]